MSEERFSTITMVDKLRIPFVSFPLRSSLP